MIGLLFQRASTLITLCLSFFLFENVFIALVFSEDICLMPSAFSFRCYVSCNGGGFFMLLFHVK